MKRIFKYLSIGLIIFNFFLNSISFAESEDDDSMYTREKILEILARETVLYYQDGEEQLGSLFSNEHRLYITIDRVPQIMKDAIVSAEDESFYSNIGVDPKGILRAGINNFLHGTRQGASTITQQTVKNLYGRSQTNLITKFQEMLNAFKLERHFSKEEILEFYLNQFHVTANGRGVGIAAKYYFNKEVEELTLIEAAFIAGSVKGPEKYNPYNKSSTERQEKSKEEAFIRKNYVLERMHKGKKINDSEYETALAEQVPFNQGKFQFNEMAISQIVKRQLARPEILKSLGIETVDEIANKGYHITTTLNHPVQKSAQYGLRQNLSRIQMGLHGFAFESRNKYHNIQKPELYNFYTGKVIEKNETYRSESLTVSLGVHTCTVNTNGLGRISLILDQVNRIGLDKTKRKFLEQIPVGQYVLVSVKNIDSEGNLSCDLETRPTVQGGAIAIDKGEIMALVGGFSTNEYNRAIFAQRQPGSTFKTPVYYAGLQLGWTALDAISNVRDVFVWQNQYYYPRPDHRPKTLETTLIGAGTKSENLASVWILRHLTDKLTYAQYEDLLTFLKIRSPQDSERSVLKNITNTFNASPNDNAQIRDGIIEKIKNDLLSDLNVIRDPNLKIFAYTLHYGNGFLKQYNFLEHSYQVKNTYQKHEKDVRLNALKNNLMRWEQISGDVSKVVASLEAHSNQFNEALGSFALTEDEDQIIYMSADSWKPEYTSYLVEPVPAKYLTFNEVKRLYNSKPHLFAEDNILLDGVVPLFLIKSIRADLNNTFAEIQTQSPLEKLYWNADFRYSLGMYYTANMLNGMGVHAAFDWVPSLPLGSNPISLAELAMIYQTFLTGKTYKFYDDTLENQLAIIKRIEDANGNLIWEYQSQEFQYVDQSFSTPILNVLRSVVTAGTGYPLNWDIILRSNDPQIDKQLEEMKVRVPNFGKTGTTNDFTNGTYIGFLPYPSESSNTLSADNAITIATYIGNDDNTPMRKGWYKVYGGGAIPAWEEIAISIVKNKNFAHKLDWQNPETTREHLVPFNYGYNTVNLMVPVNSNLYIPQYNSLSDDGDLLERNIYLNDYSENGQRYLHLSLNGQISDNIFIPKRKVSFYREHYQPLLEAQQRSPFYASELYVDDED